MINHTLKQTRMNRDLHFDVENPAGRVPCLHIQNNDLGVLKLLVRKRILNRDIRDWSRQLKNRIQQTDWRKFCQFVHVLDSRGSLLMSGLVNQER